MAKYNKATVEAIMKMVATDSYTIPEICKAVGINPDTYHQWKKLKPDFADGLERARQAFTDVLAVEAKRSLRKMVAGYDYDEVKTVFEPSKGGGKDGRIKERTVVRKHVQPNATMVIFALCNTDPDNWKNRQAAEVKMDGEVTVTMDLQ